MRVLDLPIPILGLLAFVALVIYLCVGAVFSVFFVNATMQDKHVDDFAGKGWNSEHYPSYVAAMIFWPPLVALLIAALTVVGVFYGPFWLSCRVILYLTKTLHERKELAA